MNRNVAVRTLSLAVFAVCIGVSSIGSAGEGWHLNDVSILMSLPAQKVDDTLLLPTTEGAKGVLLPKDHFGALPDLLFSVPQNQVFENLRVIGIRVDPCFPNDLGGCQAQVRFVWQPVEHAENGKVRVRDTAVHTFHNLTKKEFVKLLKSLRSLKAKHGVSTKGLPLSIHPAIAKQGLKGPFVSHLNEIILRYTGEKNLSRFTYMKLNWSETEWEFAGFDVRDGQRVLMNIPRINASMQTFKNEAFLPHVDFKYGGPTPAPQGADTFNLLMSNSKDVKPSDKVEITEAAMSIYRIENPTRHNPGTIDCVSCHVAQVARVWTVNQFPEFQLESLASEFKFQSKNSNLDNVSPRLGKTNVIRTFGYFESDIAISQRVINESAHIVDQLNQPH